MQRDQVIATAAFEEGLRFTQPFVAAAGGATPIAGDQGNIFHQETSLGAYMFANGVPYTSQFQRQAIRDLASVRSWLLARLDDAKLTDCRLRREVESLSIGLGKAQSTAVFVNSALTLLRAVARYLLNCVCAALTPPCPSCEDSAVLLAGFAIMVLTCLKEESRIMGSFHMDLFQYVLQLDIVAGV